MNRLFDLAHPFFLPLWRRVALVAALLGWTALELSLGNGFWATLFGGLGIYAAYAFFVAWDDEAVRKRQEDEE